MKTTISTDRAPRPAGTYSQGVALSSGLVFISGQTPRTPDGTRLTGASFSEQAKQALENLKAIAEAAGLSLSEHAVKVTVYIKNMDDRAEFDRIFAPYFDDPLPARAIVQSNFVDFDLEVEAVLARE